MSITLYGKCSSLVKKCGSIEQHVKSILKFKSVNIWMGNDFEPYLGRNKITGDYINCLKKVKKVYFSVFNVAKFRQIFYHVCQCNCVNKAYFHL